MVATIADLEVQLLDSMNHNQVVGILNQRKHLLPPQMTAEWLAGQSTGALRMLLLAVKLIDAAWHLGEMQGAER